MTDYRPMSAQQQAELIGMGSRPRGCNQNCVQGRFCDCAPAVDADDDRADEFGFWRGLAVAIGVDAALIGAGVAISSYLFP